MMERRVNRERTKSEIIEISSEEDVKPIKGTNKKRKLQGDSVYEGSSKKFKRDIIRSPLLEVKKPKAIKKIGLRKQDSQSSNLNNSSDTIFKANEECDGSLLSAKSNRALKTWELLAEEENIDERSARNIVKLFEEDNTIPFICRYRRDKIKSDISAEKLRDIKTTYNEMIALHKKIETVIKQLDKEGISSQTVRNQMLSAKTADELDFLYSPYKKPSKGSLAERAKTCGLQSYAKNVMEGNTPLRLEMIVNPNVPDIDSIEKVMNGICHIISHDLAKDTAVLQELNRLQALHRISFKVSKTKSTISTKEQQENAEDSKYKQKAKNEESKYESYFNFENLVRYLKPHQVLAINRGEKAKFLSVKIIFPDQLKNDIKYFIRNSQFSKGCFYPLRGDIFEKSFEECFSKKIKPYLTRRIRSDLNETAKKASIEVFSKNLKQLLLISPLKGKKICGIDPGFLNGCKIALISETADLLETSVIYPHTKFGNKKEAVNKLVNILEKHNCNVIALGNGTACRETEFWITKLFEEGTLDPSKVNYSIVSEQGASIFSCSNVAKKEFPKLDVNLISAVSIARRLNDPLCEYVKIEPRHIGVGMYQHDINEKALNEALNEVVSECVSFVGVDVNTASLSLLKHIAGLTTARAEKLIEYRQKNGPLKSRKDLMKVQTIGEKTFKQCAGFIRIDPRTVKDEINLLDCTWVHPESYEIAEKIIMKCKLSIKDIGKPFFTEKINYFISDCCLEQLEVNFKAPKERIQSVLEGLKRELYKDYRNDYDKKPLFKTGIVSMSDLKRGVVISGAVSNITHFGAFVDVGVDHDGLIHVRNMNGFVLNIGDRVEVTVLDVNVPRKRINLKVESMC